MVAYVSLGTIEPNIEHGDVVHCHRRFRFDGDPVEAGVQEHGRVGAGGLEKAVCIEGVAGLLEQLKTRVGGGDVGVHGDSTELIQSVRRYC